MVILGPTLAVALVLLSFSFSCCSAVAGELHFLVVPCSCHHHNLKNIDDVDKLQHTIGKEA